MSSNDREIQEQLWNEYTQQAAQAIKNAVEIIPPPAPSMDILRAQLDLARQEIRKLTNQVDDLDMSNDYLRDQNTRLRRRCYNQKAELRRLNAAIVDKSYRLQLQVTDNATMSRLLTDILTGEVQVMSLQPQFLPPYGPPPGNTPLG